MRLYTFVDSGRFKPFMKHRLVQNCNIKIFAKSSDRWSQFRSNCGHKKSVIMITFVVDGNDIFLSICKSMTQRRQQPINRTKRSL